MNEFSLVIIDDDDLDHVMLKRLIAETRTPAKIIDMSDGLEAIEYFRQAVASGEDGPELPRLLLLDIYMPRMNGFEFLEAYTELQQENPWLTTVVLVMVTGEAQYERLRCAQYSCVKGFLSKHPTDVKQFEQTLTPYLE